MSYFEKRDLSNQKKIGAIVSQLPEYVYDYFIGIENNSSSLTRRNYAMDINIFFDFLQEILQSDCMPTCPHGRPIVTEITRYALEKRFKRVQ